jgi:hypothetical protein
MTIALDGEGMTEMPIRDSLVEQSSTSIIEPISKQITYIVLRMIGCRHLFGDNIYVLSDYNKPSLTSDEDHNALISKDRCDVKMTVSWNPTELKWDIFSFKYTQAYGITKSYDKTLVPVFEDRVAGVRLTEHQVPCTMTLAFSLQFKNRESAFMAISGINNTALKDSVINFHDLSYYYPISADMLASLYQIYLLRQSTLNQLDFQGYLDSGTRGAAQYLKQRVGPNLELIIKRQAIQAIGVLEYNESAPVIEEQDRSIDRFVVNFTYTIQFARPDALRLDFPVVICNQMVPKWMLRIQEQNYLATVYGIFQEKSITGYLRDTLSNIPVVVRLPEYDDFRPPTQPVIGAGFAEFFDAVVLLDDTPTTTIDLLNLGVELRLNPTAVEIMKLHEQEIFATTGLYNIAVYANDIQVNRSQLSIDENLVMTIAMRDKNRRYHLVISEATTIQYLDARWIKTMIHYRTFFPITVIRNLQILIDQKYCFIDRQNRILSIINRAIRTATIDAQIASLIAARHLNHFAYSFATTPEQFADYITHSYSPITQRPVYDHYVELCLAQGLVQKAGLSSGYLRTKDGFPFLPNNVRGKISSFNLPLRVEHVKIVLPPKS